MSLYNQPNTEVTESTHIIQGQVRDSSWMSDHTYDVTHNTCMTNGLVGNDSWQAHCCEITHVTIHRDHLFVPED